jgi:hypothetical protein
VLSGNSLSNKNKVEGDRERCPSLTSYFYTHTHTHTHTHTGGGGGSREREKERETNNKIGLVHSQSWMGENLWGVLQLHVNLLATDKFKEGAVNEMEDPR